MTTAKKYAAMAANNEAIAANVPKVYAAGQSSMVDESKLIPKTVSGNYISVDDVSEIPHSVACKVASANLWRGNNGYSIVGNGTVQTIYQDYSFKGKSCSMSFSCDVVSENLEYSTTGNFVYLHVMYEDGTANIFTLCSDKITSGKAVEQFNADRAKVIHYLTIFAHNRFTSGTVTLSNLMLNEGTTALPYTPYVSPESVSVTRTGRNLLANKRSDASLGGLAWVVNDDGTLNISGTTSSAVDYYYFGKNGESEDAFTLLCDVTLSTNRTDLDNNNVVIVRIDSGLLTINNKLTSIVIPAGTRIYGIAQRVYNKTIDATGIYAMLNIGTTALPYEPYNGQTLTPSADGTVEGMTSASPYMNIFTDNAGTTLEATYRMSWGMQEERERFCNAFRQGVINHSISFEWLTLSKESITSIINALSDTATGQAVTLALVAVNTAFETSSGAADGSTSAEFTALVATKTNWTITMV